MSKKSIIAIVVLVFVVIAVVIYFFMRSNEDTTQTTRTTESTGLGNILSTSNPNIISSLFGFGRNKSTQNSGGSGGSVADKKEAARNTQAAIWNSVPTF